MNEWKSDIVRVEEFPAHLKELSDSGYTVFSAVQHSVDGYYLIVSYPNPGTDGQFTFGDDGLVVKDQGVITAINSLIAVILGGELPESATGLATYDDQVSGNTLLHAIQDTIATGNDILAQIAEQSGDVDTSGTQLWELEQIRLKEFEISDQIGSDTTSGTAVWQLDQIRQTDEQSTTYLEEKLFSKFTGGEILADQTGIGGVLTFTFASTMDLIWIRTDDGGTCRVDPFGGTPSSTLGIRCDPGIVHPINYSTNQIKVYAPNGTINVWGVKY